MHTSFAKPFDQRKVKRIVLLITSHSARNSSVFSSYSSKSTEKRRKKNIQKPNQLPTARNYKLKLKIRSWKPRPIAYEKNKIHVYMAKAREKKNAQEFSVR